MKKILLILLIVLSTCQLGINEFSTEPFIEMDFNENDQYSFTLNFNSSPSQDLKVFLVNGTHKCEPECSKNGQAADCTIIWYRVFRKAMTLSQSLLTKLQSSLHRKLSKITSVSWQLTSTGSISIHISCSTR